LAYSVFLLCRILRYRGLFRKQAMFCCVTKPCNGILNLTLT
jgi:hypothetical protein